MNMKKLFVIFTIYISSLANLPAVPLPTILSESDMETYERIFDLQSRGRWDAAKRLESKVENNILMGDVLYERYMSKTYVSSGAELTEWMKNHHAHPGAEIIHKLAKRKKATTRKPSLPEPASIRRESGVFNESWTTKKYHGTTGRQVGQFRSALKRRDMQTVVNIMNNADFKKNVSNMCYGRLAGRLAFIAYNGGQFEIADEWGRLASGRGSEFGTWTMGLMSYKKEDYKTAQYYFEKMLDLDHINTNRKVEAAFWAGRSAERANSSRAARRHWRWAMETRPASFYGAMSAAMLGREPRYKFYDSDVTKNDIAELMKTRYGMTALALLQVDKPEMAERHLRHLITDKSSDNLIHAVHALAVSEELPRTMLSVAPVIRDRGILEIDQNVILSAQFPLPQWEPRGGWNIDRALLFAIARQESRFKANAKSHAGATGLLQLMPGTARITAVKSGIRMSSLDLTNPEDSMFLGQQHVLDLFALENVDNNIIKMLASYNAGNGRLRAFERRFETDDPLLYIESFPAHETRDYIKKVMSNLWLYRARLGQPMSNLSELASGRWPHYASYDDYAARR